MGHVVVEAPGNLCAFALAQRLTRFKARLEPAAGEVSPVRLSFAERDLGPLLSEIEHWLSDYGIDAVDLLLDGQTYQLAAPAVARVRPRPLSELPDELILDA